MGVGSSTAGAAAGSSSSSKTELTINDLSNEQIIQFLERYRRIKEVKGEMDDLKMIEIMRNVDWSKDNEYLFVPAAENHSDHSCPVVSGDETAELSAPPLPPIAIGFPPHGQEQCDGKELLMSVSVTASAPPLPDVVIVKPIVATETICKECEGEQAQAVELNPVSVSSTQSKKNKKKHRK